MMLTETKSLLFSLLTTMTMTSSVLANQYDGRIVGGDEATPGDYPYFVDTGGCGGALIAPDMVLTAAHCGSRQGLKLTIGAYKWNTLNEGAQERICEQYTEDARFNQGAFLNYDFALCKLNEPVTIDSNIKLELNEKDATPKEGKNLLAMGFGRRGDGSFPDILHDVKVPAISNEKCSTPEYYGSDITDVMLCAGFEEGGKDSCQGDSGGPLVRRKKNDDGTFTDSHVGVVSWGFGCAIEFKPGVYARTSANIEWIKDTSCAMGSIADFCTGEGNPCKDDDSLEFKNDPKKDCNWVGKGKDLERIETRCNKKWKGGKIYEKWCPQTCGEKVGLGSCS